MNVLVFIIVFLVLFCVFILICKRFLNIFGNNKKSFKDKFEKAPASKNNDKILKYLRKIVLRTKDKERLSNIYEEIGNYYFSIGSYANAIIEYRNSMANGTETLQRKMSLAKSLYKVGNIESTLTEYMSMLKLYNDNKEIYFKIGVIYFENEQYRIAYDYFSKAEEIDSKFTKALKYKGVSASFLDKNDEALSILTGIYKDKSKDTLLEYGLAKAYMNKKDYSNALDHYKLVLPDLLYKETVLYEISLCYMALGDYNNATLSLEEALKLRPRSKETLLTIKYSLAICYEKTKKINKAIDILENILFLDSEYKDVSEQLEKYQSVKYSETILAFFKSDENEFLEKSINIVSNMLLYPYSYQYTQTGSLVVYSRESDVSNSAIKAIYIRKTSKPIEIEEIISIFEYNKKSNIVKSTIITYAMSSPEVIRHATISHIEVMGLKKIENLLLQNRVVSTSTTTNISKDDEVLPF